MKGKSFLVGALAVGGVVAASMLAPSAGLAQTDNVTTAMAALKAQTGGLGPPHIVGTDTIAGKAEPALYFGKTNMSNNTTVVDNVTGHHGGFATIFVKSGNDFVRVATNVKKADGTRPVGTTLNPSGTAMPKLLKAESFYGDQTILGKLYSTGYEPILDDQKNVIGAYFVGYPK